MTWEHINICPGEGTVWGWAEGEGGGKRGAATDMAFTATGQESRLSWQIVGISSGRNGEMVTACKHVGD